MVSRWRLSPRSEWLLLSSIVRGNCLNAMAICRTLSLGAFDGDEQLCLQIETKFIRLVFSFLEWNYVFESRRFDWILKAKCSFFLANRKILTWRHMRTRRLSDSRIPNSDLLTMNQKNQKSDLGIAPQVLRDQLIKTHASHTIEIENHSIV